MQKPKKQWSVDSGQWSAIDGEHTGDGGKSAKRLLHRVAALSLALVLLLTLGACGEKTPETANLPDSQISPASSPAASPANSPANSPAAPAASPASSPANSPAESQQPQQNQTAETKPAAEPVELIVFAAASMTETLTEIAELYKAVAPEVTVYFNFDSSGTLKTQIQEGAECDIFISAGQKQVDQLDIAASADVNTEGLDFILGDTRINLLENKVTLVVPPGNPANINSFSDMAEALSAGGVLMAMGNSDVPVGQYTQSILKYFSLDEQALAGSGVISYGSNVKEVTVQVSEDSVDFGVVYATDAFSAGLTVVDLATGEMCGRI
ncbi:MAG: molybdate ABC transporter substrate-binding protein, partial [Oscillospiraceae bacterium]|nr:molybdate ABC transporter substrate-binding protein [Oscillospiraceae bacterium]